VARKRSEVCRRATKVYATERGAGDGNRPASDACRGPVEERRNVRSEGRRRPRWGDVPHGGRRRDARFGHEHVEDGMGMTFVMAFTIVRVLRIDDSGTRTRQVAIVVVRIMLAMPMFVVLMESDRDRRIVQVPVRLRQ